MHTKRMIPLRIKLSIMFSAVVVISLLVQIVVSYTFYYDTTEKRTREYFQQTIQQTNLYIDASLKNYEKLSKNIIANEGIQNALHELDQSEKNYREASYDIKQNLAELTIAEENINSIQLFQKDRSVISYTFVSDYADYNEIVEQPWYKEAIDATGRIRWLATTPKINVNIGKNSTYVFSAVRKIKSTTTGKELAVMMINIDEKELRNIMKNVELGSAGTLYLLDKENRIISNKEGKRIGEIFDEKSIAKETTIIVKDTSKETGWTIVGIVPKSEYREDIEKLNVIFGVLSIIAIIAILIFATAVSKSIVRPIQSMIKVMKEVQKGNLHVAIAHKENNELGVLADQFNYTIEELNFYIEKVYKQEISKREAELQSLQAKLNPHFLYNTLDTIYWMLIMNDEEEIGDIVVALADILRYSIGDGKEFVAVEEDMIQIENYLAIQKARFHEKLSYEITIEEDIKEYHIPKLLIQPLVENSIRHGFKKNLHKGQIKVNAYKEKEYLIFRIVDNGIGMTKEEIEDVFKGNVKESPEHTGIGVLAVDTRIKLLYGGECGINIESKPGERTIVEVRLHTYTERGKQNVTNSTC